MSKGIDPFNASNWTNEYEKGGSLPDSSFKIVDKDGEDYMVGVGELEVIELAERLGMDSENEVTVDEAIDFIDSEGSYSVSRMAEKGGYMARGGNTGNYNTGRSWHMDRSLFANGQEYEVQYRKHRKG